MRVLVTGATGLVGSAVTRELARRGHSVRVLARPTSDLGGIDGAGAEVARGDVLDAPSVAAALAGCDAVVHTAGKVGFRSGQRAEMLAVNARGVEVVLGAALAAGVSRAVLTSSISVTGGTRTPRVADEATPSNAEALGIDYFVSKLRGEQAALALARRGLPVVVVRPGYVLGPGDVRGSSASTVLALARRRLRVYVDGGISVCHVADVARGHAEALERGRPGEAYVLGGANVEMRDLVARVARLAGVPPPRRVPYPVALASAAASSAVARLRGRASALTPALVRSSALYTWASSEKARRELGYEIRPLDDMIRDTLRFYLARGRLDPSTPELRALAA
jgi:dihydroflavonol-4-reductase